jgi:hypothetical protein
MAVRFDNFHGSLELLEPERSKEGFLKCHAIIARTGVLTYRDSQGRTTAELIPPEELFDEASLKTLGGKPFTNDHPLDTEGRPVLVDPDNAKDYSKGTIGNDIAADRKVGLVRVTIDVHDGPTIAAIDAGKRQISNGRLVGRIDQTAGVWVQGEQRYYTGESARGKRGVRFDCIQRDLRYNHAAAVDAGRAGAHVAIAMRADSAMAIMPSAQPNGGPNMAKIRIDSVEYEVGEGFAAAYGVHMAGINARLDGQAESVKALQSDKTKADGELAAYQAKIAELQTRVDSVDPVKMVADRRALEAKAAPMIKVDDADVAAMTDREVRLAAIQGIKPDFTGAEMSDEEIVLFFDGLAAAFESFGETQTNDGRGGVRQARADGKPASAPDKARAARQARWAAKFDFRQQKANANGGAK